MILANVHGRAVLKNNDKSVYIKHVWIKIQEDSMVVIVQNTQ